MLDEQLTELQNSIAAALVAKPLAICTAAIDEAFDDAFGTGGRDSELRDLIDCYEPFYDAVGQWVADYTRMINTVCTVCPNDNDLPQIQTLFGHIRGRAAEAIYCAISNIFVTYVTLSEAIYCAISNIFVTYVTLSDDCEFDDDQLSGFEAAAHRLEKIYGLGNDRATA